MNPILTPDIPGWRGVRDEPAGRASLNSSGRGWDRARLWRVALGWTWALAMMLLGLTLWEWPTPAAPAMRPLLASLAAVGLCGAQFIFLVLVADNLCPYAPASFRRACQTVAGLLTWMSMIWAASVAMGALQQGW